MQMHFSQSETPYFQNFQGGMPPDSRSSAIFLASLNLTLESSKLVLCYIPKSIFKILSVLKLFFPGKYI
jgi:hypothetical protein